MKIETLRIHIPTHFSVPLRPKSKIEFIQKRRDIENQRRMIATKVERDPIYHLTGGKFAQDAKAKATYSAFKHVRFRGSECQI